MPSGQISSALVTVVIDSERARKSRQFANMTASMWRDDPQPAMSQAAPERPPSLTLTLIQTRRRSRRDQVRRRSCDNLQPQAKPTCRKLLTTATRVPVEPQYNRCLEIKEQAGADVPRPDDQPGLGG